MANSTSPNLQEASKQLKDAIDQIGLTADQSERQQKITATKALVDKLMQEVNAEVERNSQSRGQSQGQDPGRRSR
jgi:hypothetical protein